MQSAEWSTAVVVSRDGAMLGVSLLTSCIPDATRYLDLPASGSGTQNGSLGSCPVLPTDNAWNRDVSTLPVDTASAQYLNGIAALGGNQKLRADFGGGGGAYGIPYITVPGNQTAVPVNFVDYGEESDPGPYPIPLNTPVEGGGDRICVSKWRVRRLAGGGGRHRPGPAVRRSPRIVGADHRAVRIGAVSRQGRHIPAPDHPA